MRSEFDGDASVGVVVARQGNALTRREEQLRRWAESDTSRAPASPKSKAAGRSVNFPDGIVFLACCHSGDKSDIGRLIEKGADINTANVDGLTALHQACIDDKLEMVKYLIDSGVDLDSCDNEGWTPLHATASCGYVDIAQCLIDRGARVDSCNNDGHLPVDLAASNEMQHILESEMGKHGVDADAARKAEEETMLSDAERWASAGRIFDEPKSKSGATALHVAAAKGYASVIQLLLRAGSDVNRADNDGWTPLHAAAHWGEKEAAKLLVLEAHADVEKVNKVGQTAFDVGDSKMVALLEDLRDKQRAANPNMKKAVDRILKEDEEPRRSSVTRLSIDEKQRVKLRSRDCLNNSSLESSVDDEEDDDEDEDGEDDDDDDDEEVVAEKENEAPRKSAIRPSSITLPVAGGASTGNPTVGTVTPMIRVSAAVAGAASAATTTESMETESSIADEPPPSYADASELPSAQAPSSSPTPTLDPSAPSALASAAAAASQGQKRVFEPPKRDEESEAQRKAKSRRARETRRSTQGVTAEDLQAAEILLTADVAAMGKEAAISDAPPLPANKKEEVAAAVDSAANRESTSSVVLTPTSTATALADTLKQSDSFRRRARGSRHDTQDSISSNSSSASSGSSSTSSTLTAGSVAAASPIFSRSQRFGSGSSQGGEGDGIGVCTDEAKLAPPSVIVTAGGDAGSAEVAIDSGNAADAASAGQSGTGGLEVDSAYKRSSAITKRRLRAQRRSTGIPFEEDGEKKEGKSEGEADDGATPAATDATTTTTTTNTSATANDDATLSNTQRYYRSSGSSSSFGSSSAAAQPTPHFSSSVFDASSATPATSTSSSGGVSSLYGTALSANTGIADRYTRPAASATSYRQAAEMDFKKLYDEEKQENERLRMKLGRIEREMAEIKSQLEKNQKNMKTSSSSTSTSSSSTSTSSSTGSFNNNNNAFEGVESLKNKQNLERGLAETLEELKMLENLKADNMRLKEENGALIRVISKLSK